ncbi:MAG TPA: hypothetical protein VFM18_04405 [Methanosarcina sp.]|nr:hypothetical protein [Methanosarcina sp.]
MGGNALSFETRRVTRDEYFYLVEGIKYKLNTFGVLACADIPAYKTKPDFGDIDILVVSEKPNKDKWIRELFNPKEIYHNSNVFSFDYHGVQVDLIFTKLNDFQSSIDYFSFNDLGNLLGRVYHKMGLRFGHDGLTLVVRDDTQVVGEIELSKNIDEILTFGGYDPIRYHQGFETKLDIFKFAASSPYYNYEIFDLDNRNYRARTRDRKRPTYTEFLVWAQENATETGYEWNSNKAAYLPRILHTFNKIDEFSNLLKQHSLRLQFKEKFNGNIVAKLTGLQGKQLGAFMAQFKKIFTQDDILKMTHGMIAEEILTFAKDYDDR